jgi:hypothetical protein
MVFPNEIIAYLDDMLEIGSFSENGPNGPEHRFVDLPGPI